MTTLAIRLSGPLQAWGEQSQFNRRNTLGYPTYSGLLGLLRAAFGVDRRGIAVETGSQFDDSLLRSLSMSLRIDSPGREVWDYHTINPPPRGRYTNIGYADRNRLATISIGGMGEWRIKGVPQTLVTRRAYLQGAVFLWLISGDSMRVERAAKALSQPYWQLSLGRKACTPDFPFVLGTSPVSPEALARQIPVVGEGTERLAFHSLNTPAANPVQEISHYDSPLGAHPQDGYATLTRTVSYVDAPRVADRGSLFSWCKEALT